MNRVKSKLFFLLAVVLFALATLVLTIFNNNPFQSDGSVFILFFLSLFISLAGLSTIVILFIKSRFLANSATLDHFWPSIRQGSLISATVTLLLFLQGIKVLDFWVGVPLTIAIVLLELFFRGNRFRKS